MSRTPIPDSVGAQDYVFRFDAPIGPIAFSGELDVNGWLLDRKGTAINGIRAIVRQRFRRRQQFRARRKRNRPDVAAAFPDLPEAMASGFLLELKLGFGRSHITFQVLDHKRVWQTFSSATIFTLSLSVLARLGLLNLHRFLIARLKPFIASKSFPQARTASERPQGARPSRPTFSTRQVHLFATSKSNLFILEIGELVAAGFRELGCDVRLCLDELPSENPPPDTLQMVVTPHEYYNLFLSGKLPRQRLRDLTRHVFLLCTEQPATAWFQSNLQWAASARGVADIHPLGVSAYRAQSIPCHQLQLGYHPMLAHDRAVPHRERKLDVTFLGSMTPRRDEFFAKHADFFSDHNCHVRLVPLGFAKTKTTRSYLSAERRNELLSNSRILLNVHYSEQKYFEWHRMLVGLANGCCIITDTCEGYGALEPGKHFIMVEPEYLIPCCEYYLAHPEECEHVAKQGLHFVQTQLQQVENCRAFLHAIEDRAATLPDLSQDAVSTPLPSALKWKFFRQTARLLLEAAAADFRNLVQKGPPSQTHIVKALPEVKRREAVLKKREAFRARWIAQEEARAKGECPFNLHDNPAFAECDAPQLSVLITLYNYEQFIQECVESVEKAVESLSQPLEILIVNDASIDDSLTQALRCQRRSSLPFRIIDKTYNTGLADARNIGIEHARAPYIFMLDADNLIYPNCLRQLFDAISDGPHSAAYAMLCRFRGNPSNRIGLLSYFDWDPEILVQQPYIDAMAMFRRDALLEGSGYDHHLSQVGWFGWEDYDLWLRLAQDNREVAFVPNILCLYRQHDASMIKTTNLFEAELVDHLTNAYAELLGRFPPRSTLFGVERGSIRAANRANHAVAAGTLPARYFIASGCPITTTTLYRCVHLQEQLRHLGYHVELVEWFDETAITSHQALSCDVLFLYRLPMSFQLERLIDQARESGKLVIFDTDDLIFEPSLIEAHRGVQNLSVADQRLYAEGVQRYLTTLRACDAALTATPLLADLCRRRSKPAFVHRNCLGSDMLAVADRLYRQRRDRTVGDRIIVGYGSGTPTHDVDFREAAAAIATVLDRFPQVELWIAGPLLLPPQIERFGERVRRFPLTHWREWLELASRMDIALAPLEMNNIFCRAKSEIKFVEAGALGVPVVASHIDPFKHAITNGQDGFLAANESEWTAALTALIEQPAQRLNMGARARATVLQHYSLDARAIDLAAILPHLLAAPAQKEQAVAVSNPLVVNWLVPEPFPGAGGDTGIFRIIRYLAAFGHDCHVYVVPFTLMNDYTTEQVRHYVRQHFGDTTAQYHKWNGTVGDADAAFATFWRTVENLRPLPNSGRRYYLVQDFEPFFYPTGSEPYLLAEDTYRTGFHCVTLGPWLARFLQERYQATADYFDFAVDTETYWPRPGLRDANRRVCFYARPSTPRRAYEVGLEALRLVKARLVDVEIVFFGTPELTPEPTYPIVNRGLLTQDELATLFSSSDVGLVLSLTNPSFVPLEMMACGCAVVEVASDRMEGVLRQGEDAWLVEPTANAVADGIIQLLEDTKLRERLVENAYQRVRKMDWRHSARQIEAVLLREA